MTAFREITTGLRFPEGPIAMPDGSVMVVEIERGTLTRVMPDGTQSVIARTGGGPNGAAIGPDGKCYVCNNGGFKWHEEGGLLRPVLQAEDYSGGRIERVDLETGEVEVLYWGLEGTPLKGPNDIVFDRHGGFWFTDLGKVRQRDQDRGLSPQGDRLYVAESLTGRLWVFDITGPGEIRREPWPSPNGGRLLAGLPDYQLFDSLAVEADGNICVATLVKGAISVFSPDGAVVEQKLFPDHYVTNICFGGPDKRTAFITLSHAGRLVAVDWPRRGLVLAH